jgi:hypothetical protein
MEGAGMLHLSSELYSEYPARAGLAAFTAGLVLGAVICGAAFVEASDIVRYADFGAVGDGETDDFDAIIAAHEHANRHALPVRAEDGAVYYIGKGARTAMIETDTDFGEARFTIDDRGVPLAERGHPVFLVRSKLAAYNVKAVERLARGQRNIGRQLPGRALLLIRDHSIRRFIRYGSNQNSGAPQTDMILVDENGDVDSATPIIWDFKQISQCRAYPVDPKTLHISGGDFTTRANGTLVSSYQSYSRGIEIRRSNVIIDGLDHFVGDEGDHGPPYGGFIHISECSDITVKNTRLSGRKTYRDSRGVSMGSYDIGIHRAVNVAFLNVSQTNDIHDRSRWGIMGSNYCKNLIYDSCSLSRFDAHQGVVNATIRNSSLRQVTVTGQGLLRIENSSVRDNAFIHLRSDYGSTWKGTVMIKDCKWIPSHHSAAILSGHNHGQHDFGYTCHMPERIVIDNLEIDDSAFAGSGSGPAIFANFNRNMKNASYEQSYPYIVSKQVVLRNVRTASGRELRLSDNEFMFRDVEILRH